MSCHTHSKKRKKKELSNMEIHVMTIDDIH